MMSYFIDPIYRAPMFASMMMCLASSLIGVLIFLKKRSLLSETLSHSTYPGVTLALMIAGFFSIREVNAFLVLSGAFAAALLGFAALNYLEKRGVKEDAALTFVLASFFGIGVTLSSFIQSQFPHSWRNVHAYLYGQVATLTDFYIFFYAGLALIVVLAIFLFFKELQMFLFDRNFAITAKNIMQRMELLFVFLVVIAVVIGMRSVGLILISAMLIAPAIFARAFTDNLKTMFVLAGGLGLFSAMTGNILALTLSSYYKISFPTGPTIVLIASVFSVYALLFAPKRGLVFRYFRILNFQFESLKENLLKALWRTVEKKSSFTDLKQITGASKIFVFFALLKLCRKKAVIKENGIYQLTALGQKAGAKIIRLHRLWEVYLVEYLGVHTEKVHKSAEEIEHILNHDLEKALIELLDDPRCDPHNQPIPTSEEISYA